MELHLIAYDEASSVIESVGSNLSATFTDVEGKTQNLMNTTDEATGKMAGDYERVETASSSLTDAQKTTTMSFGQQLLAVNNLATGSFGLVTSFERVENAQVAVDRANLTVQRSTKSVNDAQENYNKAVEKYGADSPQAVDAANKLKIAQDALEVAHERADMANRNANSTIMTSVLTVIPSFISVISSLTAVKGILTAASTAEAAAEDVNAASEVTATGATGGLAAAADIAAASETAAAGTTGVLSGAMTALGGVLDFLSANPIVLIVAAIAAIVFVLVEAYEHCGWFRDIINAIGTLLINVFKQAIDAVTGALTWLWKNVLEPVGNFLSGALKVAFDVIMVPVKAFMDAINWLVNAGKGVLDFFGGLGKALAGLCFAHAAPAAAIFNETVADSLDLTNKLTDGVTGLGGSLRDLAGVGAVALPTIGGGMGVGGLGAGGVPTPMAAMPVNVYVTAPLVNVQGSADMATAAYAAKLVQGQLSSVVLKPTSPNAPAANQQVIVNPGTLPGATPTGLAAQSSSYIMGAGGSVLGMVLF